MDNKLSELTVGAFCIHKTKWGKRGCEVVAFHNGSVVVKHFASGYRGVPANSLAVTTEENARRIERNHYAEVKRG
ncbi:hypothetical protein [Serratia plymuthica]|uniref:hypothetical protein n=1 Tax=Serratia plymuthica TaxID=82996 RepID=UPI0011147B1E|nr:hypothetical protein [Serratia plymuthica]